MVLRKFMGIFTITLIVCAASLATAGVPQLDQCSATSAYGGSAVLLNVPNGNGNAFTAARALGSVPDVNATITVVVNDGTPAPIANYPSEDIWLVSLDGGVAICNGGSTADGATDAMGMTTFVSSMQAGGWSQADSQVMINGLPIPGTVSLSHNSPDNNGDLAVNLTDVGIFAADFFDVSYNFRSDLYFDGDINLSDLSKLSAGMGALCP